MEVAVPVEQRVVLALRKSHHQGPFKLATVTFDQRCHKGLPLRVPMVLPEECSGGRFQVCLKCIVFQDFCLRAALGATLRVDLRAASALLLANATSSTVINQPKMPRSRLATRTCGIPLSGPQRKMNIFRKIRAEGALQGPSW